MEYPLWLLDWAGGGFWVALISTLHVYVAQFAVGGGLFLVATEIVARRRNSDTLRAYLKKHVRFFLLLTMVFGGVSGVGIWFSIALANPQGTIVLIHNFVFAWATEWVFFLGEIVALLVYYYKFDKLRPRDHMAVGWLYFIFAWLSLFMVNGIVAFMLTPGDWLVTRDFWDGFFNPTTWPSLVFRTFLSFMLAGLFGFLTATRIKDPDDRMYMVRWCALWALVPFVLFLASGWWYFAALPEATQAMILGRSARMNDFFHLFQFSAPFFVIGCLLLAFRLPKATSSALAALVLVAGFGLAGSFEFMREAGRKPWIIGGLLYSSSVLPEQVQELNTNGMLATAKWARVKEVTDDNELEAGRALFLLECSSCHANGGPMNDILPRTAKFPLVGLQSYLSGMEMAPYMPPFFGTDRERDALARYIWEDLHKGMVPGNAEISPEELPQAEPPKLDRGAEGAGGDEYVLVASSSMGVRTFSDADGRFSLLPPGSGLKAVLIRRGDSPEVVTEGATIDYALPEDIRTPASALAYWQHSASLTGKTLPENEGPGGAGTTGELELDEDSSTYVREGIPAIPYTDGDTFNPYPYATIKARADDGTVLAETMAVVPTSTEMGCRNCHGGEWKFQDMAGVSKDTAGDILTVHDRISGTNLSERADKGEPLSCAECHGDSLQGREGRPELLNLSASIHGFHANYLKNTGAEACSYCHPSREDGPTRFMRGRHAMMGIECVDCHGYMEDHAISLLKQEADKPAAASLMSGLLPRSAESVEAIAPRSPWVNEPDCLTCHTDEFTTPETMSAFGTWTDDEAGLFRKRKDFMEALPCTACHNAPHVVYPADNAYGMDRDNVQPLQYQDDPGTLSTGGNCTVCHTVDMEFSGHHPNQLPEEQGW